MLLWKLSQLLFCVYLLSGGIQEVNGKEKVVNNLKGVLGGSVNVPCDVDVEKCGEVFTTTWTKDQKRIYFNDGGQMEKALQQFADPERARYFMSNSSSYLQINSLRVEDGGNYSCDVTYTKTCPSLTYSVLIILVRPTDPKIIHEENVIEEDKVIGPFLEGETLSLDCETTEGKPTAEVTWRKNGEILRSEPSYTENSYGSQDVKSGIDLVLTRDDIGAKLVCQVENEAIDKPLEDAIILDLNVKPSLMEVSGPKDPIREHETIQLSCIVKGAKPAAEITWYNVSQMIDIPSEDEIKEAADGTFDTFSELRITVTRYDHKGTFFCKGINDVLKDSGEEPMFKSLYIEVEYAPVVLIEPIGGHVINESTDVMIVCTYDANPSNITDVEWYKEGEELIVSKDSKYSTSYTEYPELVINDIDRDDRGIYSCSLSNAIGKGSASNSIEIIVLYPPVVEATVSPNKVNEDAKSIVSLFCEIKSGHPQNLLRVRWYKNDEFLNESTEKETSWKGIIRNMTGNYSCEGENTAGWGNRSEEQELLVQYLPGKADIKESDAPAIKGESVTLICDVNEMGLPEANSYYWELDGEEIRDQDDRELTIDELSVEHQGNYSCSAVNDVGLGEKSYHFLDIKAPPKFIIKPPKIHGAARDAAFYNVTCRVECEPICDIDWLKDGEDIMDSDLYIVTTDILPEDEFNNHFSSVESVLRWNMTAWPGGKLERERDTANYTCQSTDNEVGDEVETIMQFSVEYAPEDLEVTTEHPSVEEGGDVDPINCSASSWPPSKYRWLFGKYIISNSPTLELYNVTRKHAGTYVCVATNPRGHAQIELSLEVLYIPDCEITMDIVDEDTVLTCEGFAHTVNLDFYWERDNETLDSDIDDEDDDLKSVYKFSKFSIDHYGNYECTVKNFFGESTCNLTYTEELAEPWDPDTGEKKIFIIAAVVGSIAILFLIIIVIIIIVMKRKRSTDASAAKPAPAEALYQNIEASDHKENGLSEPESKPMYENMPFFGRSKGPFRPDINDDLLYADMYDDVKTGKVPDPRMKPPLPPKGIGKKPKEPPLPPKTRKKAPSSDII